jgi:hypothetical protein
VHGRMFVEVDQLMIKNKSRKALINSMPTDLELQNDVPMYPIQCIYK